MNTQTRSGRVLFASSRASNATSGNMPSLRVVVRRPQTVIERARRDEMWIHASFAGQQIVRGRCHEGSSAGDSLLHQTVLFHLVIIVSAEPASHYVVQSVSAPIRSIVSRETRSLIAERGPSIREQAAEDSPSRHLPLEMFRTAVTALGCSSLHWGASPNVVSPDYLPADAPRPPATVRGYPQTSALSASE